MLRILESLFRTTLCECLNLSSNRAQAELNVTFRVYISARDSLWSPESYLRD